MKKSLNILFNPSSRIVIKKVSKLRCNCTTFRLVTSEFILSFILLTNSSDTILFSDDDGIFNSNAIDAHVNNLKKYVFCAGSIIRDRLLNRKSKSILQGTNYSFQKQFFKDVGGYDEAFVQSQGGGDVDFWYRIYRYVQLHKLPVAFLPNTCQNVTMRSERKKTKREMDPREYTLNKHKLTQIGPMYKWFPEIRDKSTWMQIIND